MKTNILKIFLIMIFVLGVYTITSSATYISNDPTVSSGDTFSITVTSTEGLENYDIKLSSYNGLTFSGCSGTQGAVVNSSNGAVSFASPGSAVTTLATYTFKAPEVSETKTYSVIFNINGTANTSNVTVKPKETQSNSNQQNTNTNNSSATGSLSSITVNGKTYTNPNKDITITVGNEVESTTVSAVSSNGSAVSGTGTVKLKEGPNTVNLVVNGTTYIVRINRLTAVSDEPNIIEDEAEQEEETKEALALSTLEIEGFTLVPEFSKDVYTYTLDIDMEEEDVQELEITAIPNQENAKVEITGNENLQEGENIINITLASEDGEETVTYQITVNKIVSSTEVVGKTDMNQANQELENATKFSRTQQIVIITIAVIGAIAGIIFAIIEYRYTNKEEENEYNEPFYIKEDEEGRLNIVDKEETEQEDVRTNASSYPEKDEQTGTSESTGYIEDLYKSNFSEEDLEEDIQKEKRKKAKGKHF